MTSYWDAQGTLPTDGAADDLSGTWSGYSTAGSIRLDYEWDILQDGDCLEGTISLALAGSGDWSRYAVSGEIEGDRVQWRGTGWLQRASRNFCLAAGALALDDKGGERVLSGHWGPND